MAPAILPVTPSCRSAARRRRRTSAVASTSCALAAPTATRRPSIVGLAVTTAHRGTRRRGPGPFAALATAPTWIQVRRGAMRACRSGCRRRRSEDRARGGEHRLVNWGERSPRTLNTSTPGEASASSTGAASVELGSPSHRAELRGERCLPATPLPGEPRGIRSVSTRARAAHPRSHPRPQKRDRDQKSAPHPTAVQRAETVT